MLRQYLLLAMCLALFLLCAACGGHGSHADGGQATPSGTPPQFGSLTLSIGLSGVDLYRAHGAASDLGVGVVLPKASLRRIEDGEFPFSVGDVSLTSPTSWTISRVPMNQHLLLQVSFSPRIDLATGAAKSAKDKYIVVTHIPVRLTKAGLASYSATISILPNPAGGYFVDTRSRRTNFAETEVYSREDYGAATVARDSDADGAFADEAQLADNARLGISPAMLDELDASNSSSASNSALFTGAVASISAADGTVSIAGLHKLGEPITTTGVTTVRFAEGVRCNNRTVFLLRESVENVPPAQLATGDNITFSGTELQAGSTTTIWLQSINKLTLDIPVDTIVAVPSGDAVRPGEPVHVTVYVNKTQRNLRELKQLRVSFDSHNRYLSGSLDPGERGGGGALADGIWSALGASAFVLPNGEKTVSGSLDRTHSYVDLSLIPSSFGEIEHATGALCNFDLVCHSDAAVSVQRGDDVPATVYSGSGGDAQWSNCVVSTQSDVVVKGKPVLLSLATQLPGQGNEYRPYRGAVGASIQLRLVDPLAGDVTASPLAQFDVDTHDGIRIPTVKGRFTIPAGMHGMIHADAIYNGIYCDPASEVYLFVDDQSVFALQLHDIETNIFGGSAASYELQPLASDDEYTLRVNAHGAHNLHALYFTMKYDPTLYLAKSYVFGPALGDAAELVAPASSLLQYGAADGQTVFGVCQLHPQTASGFTGDGCVVELSFMRRRMVYDKRADPYDKEPELPNSMCCDAHVNAAADGLIWYSAIPGDFNQDGSVDYTTDNAAALGDMTVYAMHCGASVDSAHSLLAAMDRRWDYQRQDFSGNALIDQVDFVQVMAGRRTRVETWGVFYSPVPENYPDRGSLKASMPFSEHFGDPSADQIWFEWESLGSLKPGYYWIRPGLGASYSWSASQLLHVE